MDGLKSDEKGKYSKIVKLDQNTEMSIDIEYELTELQKDIIYLEQGEEALMDHFISIHPDFKSHLDAALQKI